MPRVFILDFDSIKNIVEEFFNGQYEVVKFLGEGTFAKVYLVKHKFLDDSRAMKIIKEPIKPTTNTRTIFEEVRIATRLRNSNIINIYDAGIISDIDDIAYFVMEYVPGGDLKDYLNSFIKSNIQMPVSRALNIMKQILTGLNTLHSSTPPIIHRDLKLNNILLNYNANGDIEIKISDFGFAKEVTTTKSDIDIVGTRPYMAPECFSKNISLMTDIYAVGVIFYELLTSQYPYDIDSFSLEEILELKPWNNQLKAPSSFNSKISQKLDNIVLKCLNINPNERYKNAGEVLVDIELIIEEMKSNQPIEYADEELIDDYSDYIINSNILKAFELAKTENGLNEAIALLEKEIFKDYNVRQYYAETLRLWKSEMPDIRLISKAFTVNLNGKNYELSCNLLKEAIAYNPKLKKEYDDYIRLWSIFHNLSKDKNLIKAVLDLEELMHSSMRINNIYKSIINILKTYSVDEIVSEAIRLVNMNNLTDGANLMEFVVVCNLKIRNSYQYKLSLWKQNMDLNYNRNHIKENTVNYAIDLGTTDSIVSYYNKGDSILIKNHNTGDVLTPSAVLLTDDNIEVGSVAREALYSNENNAISEFKHNMGFPVAFAGESSRVLLPEELSAEVLKDLRLSVYEQCKKDMNQAVICVPARSNPINTKAIIDAAVLAGFKSYNLIFEPVAVALEYDFKNSGDDLWMIYDLGGGTFNVSILKNNDAEIEILATAGLDNLGGNDFDWRIVDEVLTPVIINDLHLNDFRRDNLKYRHVFSKLKNASEKAKIKLSESAAADISITNLFSDYDLTYNLDESEFKKIINPLVKTTFNLCYDLLNNKGMTIKDMDKIILVGGSCLSSTIRKLIHDEFSRPIEYSKNPLTAVVKGAAKYAGNLEKLNINSQIESVSIVLNRNGNDLNGLLFTNEDNYLFLGYYIQFNDIKIPVKPNGRFKTNLNEKEYEIKVYREDKLIRLDEKSPNKIKQDMMYIPYFNETFTINSKLKSDMNYQKLTESISSLKDYAKFDEIALKYLKQLMKLPIKDNQTQIYMNYFKTEVDKLKQELEYETLLDNVKNKANILNKKISPDEIRDYSHLKAIHEKLIDEYYKLNKNNVIEECFFNLRYEGVYSQNLELSQNLIQKALLLLNKQNYDDLVEIIIKLYDIDERSF